MFRKTISSEIDIAAPPEAVWALLCDLGGYGAWNPFIRKAEGTLAVGRRLKLALQIPGGMKMRIRPRLTEVSETREIRWLGHLVIPGLFDGDHRFQIFSRNRRHTRLRQEEIFSGLLVPVFGSWIAGGALRGFDAMNRAAKTRLEAPAPAGRASGSG